MRIEPHLPSQVGFDALTELDTVDWTTLEHAYGRGVVGDELSGDVARSLALLHDDPQTALADGLWSNVCHQGTVYESSAYAFPFVSAVAAGDVPQDVRSWLASLLGGIAVGGSCVAPSGSFAGSFGDGVDELVRQTVVRCDGYLASIERADPTVAPTIAAIRLVTNEPSDAHREAALDIIDPG